MRTGWIMYSIILFSPEMPLEDKLKVDRLSTHCLKYKLHKRTDGGPVRLVFWDLSKKYPVSVYCVLVFRRNMSLYKCLLHFKKVSLCHQSLQTYCALVFALKLWYNDFQNWWNSMQMPLVSQGHFCIVPRDRNSFLNKQSKAICMQMG